MNMKTSPNDVSNTEVMKELKKLSFETKEEIKKLSLETKEEIKKLSTKVETLSTKVDANQSEVLEAVQGLAEHMDDEFSKVRSEMATKDELHSEIGKLKTTMVTKGYLDDKLADFHSDIVRRTRQEIEKAIH